jgi:hypothetical protein
MLDRIWYLAENGLTSLMVLHDFLSKHLTPLQDHPRPVWMYTGVKDIMRLDRWPGSSLGDNLLVACLKELTSDNFSVELVAPPAPCEPICMNQAARTVLLAAMPTLDDIDIATVHRGDLSRGMAIPGSDASSDLGGTTSGHGGVVIIARGGGPAGGSPACDRGGGPTGNRGRGATGGSDPALTPARARKNRCGSSSMTMKYHLMRTRPYKGSSGRHPLPVGQAVQPPPWLM